MQSFRRHIHHCPNHMKNFFVITNALTDVGLTHTHQIADYITEKGGSCRYIVSVDKNGAYPVTADMVEKDVDAVLVIGGDGTLIRAARDLVERHIPLIGVNLGHLGYLCELEENSVFAAIDEMLDGHYTIEKRMMLTGYVVKENKRMHEMQALNDIVIHRTGPLQIVNLNVYVNGEYLYNFKADGIILATPTGSTGYSMSAGGPIVDPKANMLLMTPINAHTLNAKSIVIGAEDEVMIEIGTRHEQKDEQVEVSFDGDYSVKLKVGDRIVVHKAEASTNILRLSKMSFLEILRKKMQNYT